MIFATLPTGEAIGYTWGGANIKEPDFAVNRQVSVLRLIKDKGWQGVCMPPCHAPD